MQQSIKRSLEPTTSPSTLSTKANDFLRRRAGLLTLLAAGSCSPGEIGQAVRPDTPTAAQGLDENSCAIREDHSNPLIVDWKDHQRDDLEIAMKQKLVVVSYDCKTLRMLPNCKVDSTYGFISTTTKERMVRLENADELKANLPTFGSRIEMDLGASLDRGATIDIALVTVGRIMTTRSAVSRDLLEGDCDDATHFVRGATVGAFAMQTGTKGEVKTAAQLFGAGISASSSSEKRVNAKNGRLESCQEATAEMSKPPSGCSAPVRLHLTAIGKKESKKSNTEKVAQSDSTLEACPEGLVMNEGKCTKKKEAPHQCKEGDLQGCTTQCERGHLGSCRSLGEMYDYGEGVSENNKKAAELYKKACDGGLPVGCNNLGIMYDNGEGVSENNKKAAELYKKACDGGKSGGCYNLGVMYNYGEGVQKNKKKAAESYKKACDGGLPNGCNKLGGLYHYGIGVPEDKKKAVELYVKTCDAGLPLGCENLGFMYDNGEGVQKNKERAAELYKKACNDDLSPSCYRLGAMYHTGRGVTKNIKKAIELYKKACDMGDKATCSILRNMGVKPTRK